MLEGTGAEVAGIMAITKIAALAYLMFNLYTPPCFAAIGAMNSEMKSAKWLWGGIGFQLAIGYTVAYLYDWNTDCFSRILERRSSHRWTCSGYCYGWRSRWSYTQHK